MTGRLAVLFVGLNVVGMLFPVFGDEASKRPVAVVHTERVPFAPGGAIQVLHSFAR